jgi:hypothetical protein
MEPAQQISHSCSSFRRRGNARLFIELVCQGLSVMPSNFLSFIPGLGGKSVSSTPEQAPGTPAADDPAPEASKTAVEKETEVAGKYQQGTGKRMLGFGSARASASSAGSAGSTGDISKGLRADIDKLAGGSHGEKADGKTIASIVKRLSKLEGKSKEDTSLVRAQVLCEISDPTTLHAVHSAARDEISSGYAQLSGMEFLMEISRGAFSRTSSVS